MRTCMQACVCRCNVSVSIICATMITCTRAHKNTAEEEERVTRQRSYRAEFLKSVEYDLSQVFEMQRG